MKGQEAIVVVGMLGNYCLYVNICKICDNVPVMCAMTFVMGGNNVANAWATSVGSGAIPLRRALIIAGVCEILGALTLGMKQLKVRC